MTNRRSLRNFSPAMLVDKVVVNGCLLGFSQRDGEVTPSCGSRPVGCQRITLGISISAGGSCAISEEYRTGVRTPPANYTSVVKGMQAPCRENGAFV